MVSVERYIKAYVKVMPRRGKIIRSLIRSKRSFDSKLKKRPQDKKRIIFNLKKIIGEDILFKSAEKRNKQTLRHYLWKFNKGFTFFLNKSNILSKKLETEPKYATQLLYLLKDTKSIAENFNKIAKDLDVLYAKEILALNKNDIESYSKLVGAEKALINQILSYGKAVKQRQGSVIKFLKYYLKGLNKAAEGGRVVMVVALLFIAFDGVMNFIVFPDIFDIKTRLIFGSPSAIFGLVVALALASGLVSSSEKIIRNYIAETIG